MNITRVDCAHPSTNFKSTYPVVHLIEVANGRYEYASGNAKKEINELFVRTLNKTLQKTNIHKVPDAQKIRAYVEEIDSSSYNSDNPHVRAFKDKSRLFVDRMPLIYILSGEEDINAFEDLYAKHVGPAKHAAKKATGSVYDDNSIQKIQTYYKEGLDFVNSPVRRLKDGNGKKVTLYTYSKLVKDAFGNVTDVILEFVKFFPNGR